MSLIVKKERLQLQYTHAAPAAALVSGKCHPFTVCCSPADSTTEQNSTEQGWGGKTLHMDSPLLFQSDLKLLQTFLSYFTPSCTKPD